MNELVERLQQEQDIEADYPADGGVQEFREAIGRSYVHMKFVNTRGGTVLGVRLDENRCDFSNADFDNGKGEAVVVGHLVLNYNKVRFSGKVDLATLEGKGKLTYLGEHKPGEEVDIPALEAM